MTPDQEFKTARMMRRRVQNYRDTNLAHQRDPNFKGRGGAAWTIHLPPPETRPEIWGAGVGMWVMHVPDAHPSWEWYLVMLIHLRDLKGGRIAVRIHERNCYDVSVVTLHPDRPLPDLAAVERGEEGPHASFLCMEPTDFMAQFGDVGGDARAYDVAESLVKKVVTGDLIPGDDYRMQWAQTLNTILRTLPARTPVC
jgi:hypothetical protein